MGYDPLTAWKLSPREITYAFKGWEAKTKYLATIERNLLEGQALRIIAPTVKQSQRVHKDASDLMRLPWESAPKKIERKDFKSNLPDVLPDISKWEIADNGSK